MPTKYRPHWVWWIPAALTFLLLPAVPLIPLAFSLSDLAGYDTKFPADGSHYVLPLDGAGDRMLYVADRDEPPQCEIGDPSGREVRLEPIPNKVKRDELYGVARFAPTTDDVVAKCTSKSGQEVFVGPAADFKDVFGHGNGVLLLSAFGVSGIGMLWLVVLAVLTTVRPPRPAQSR